MLQIVLSNTTAAFSGESRRPAAGWRGHRYESLCLGYRRRDDRYKTLLFSEDGKLMGHAYQPYETHTPKLGYSEQNAEDWWRAVCVTVREVCRDPEIAKNVAVISLSLQGGTLVAVDREFRPVRPAIVWMTPAVPRSGSLPPRGGRCLQDVRKNRLEPERRTAGFGDSLDAGS